MKAEYLEVIANGHVAACIITAVEAPVRDEEGKFIYSNKEKQIAKSKGHISNITIHVPENALRSFTVHLSPVSIKQMYKKIIEIEKKKGTVSVEDF